MEHVITQTWLLAPWAMLWLVLFRALLVRAGILPPTCPRCGRPFERRRMGDSVCRCEAKQASTRLALPSPRWRGWRARG